MEFLRYRSEDVRTALLFFPIVFVVVGECKESTQPSLVSRFSSIYSSFILGGYRSNEKPPLE